ncbi:MAG: N-acetylmuramoyl-L-alanine amidase [Phocaeicola sp.]|nr:N-acetylmuramoyl-L-alanine amidase [Phocaeicola sp.]
MERFIDTIIIHCSATKKSSSLTPLELVKMHRKRGFNGCGYHFYIRKDGEICEMRSVKTVGAHCKGHNEGSIGICYEGGLDDKGNPLDTRTEEQKKAMKFLVKILKKEYDIRTVAGHRDFSPDLNGNGEIEPHEWIKMCPCFDVRAEFGE